MALVSDYTCTDCNTDYKGVVIPYDNVCKKCRDTARAKSLQHFLVELRTGKSIEERVAQLETKLFAVMEDVQRNNVYVKSQTMRF